MHYLMRLLSNPRLGHQASAGLSRSTLARGGKADIAQGPSRATTELMRFSKPPRSALGGKTGPFDRVRPKGWIHSITRSARTSTEDGIVMPNSFATFRFTVSSKRVGCAIGSSAGFVPWTTLSTYKATPLAASSKISP